jgi:hypothetical protein
MESDFRGIFHLVSYLRGESSSGETKGESCFLSFTILELQMHCNKNRFRLRVNNIQHAVVESSHMHTTHTRA